MSGMWPVSSHSSRGDRFTHAVADVPKAAWAFNQEALSGVAVLAYQEHPSLGAYRQHNSAMPAFSRAPRRTRRPAPSGIGPSAQSNSVQKGRAIVMPITNVRAPWCVA